MRLPTSAGVASAGGRVVASPYARKLAREAGVDVADAAGSGPGGCACGSAPVSGRSMSPCRQACA
jgi:pyruvate/2-oxoglutarate dehydrogenase complex dihydrolipoamide acyltransferase (E2) component